LPWPRWATAWEPAGCAPGV